MKVLIKTILLKPQGTIIIPILKNDSLNDTLAAISTAFDMSFQRLKSDFKGDFKEIT